MFVRPLDKVVFDIVSVNCAFAVGLSEDQTRIPNSVGFTIAVEPVVATDQVSTSCKNAKMAGMNAAVVANFKVVSGRVKTDA